MRASVFVTITALMLVGCVAYPTQRTYFEPNAADGIPTPSRSCGYHAAKNDALVREVDRLYVQVSPHSDEGKPLSVTVLFRASSAPDVSPEKYELQSAADGSTFRSLSHKVTAYKPDKTHPYYSIWLTLQFQPLPEQLNEIAIVFPRGSVSLNNREVELAPFRFLKTKKNDIYYGSINC